MPSVGIKGASNDIFSFIVVEDHTSPVGKVLIPLGTLLQQRQWRNLRGEGRGATAPLLRKSMPHPMFYQMFKFVQIVFLENSSLWMWNVDAYLYIYSNMFR